ncbi:TIGR01777 family protein, partial [candidate division KSB1 bacterium]|nr:TIGR01777 family protein [candidate division KSB1 bacterium]NIR71100.1 TIGR01777 family protein [candidate division KSB1 bacterium]NIS26123.1 TIGR01777 family protein [candidate division KSB1 bacterium]NIT72918.1 TIGR01777 family protein [candidate division KSB1 bacterium]NIU26762.1 TIGR01777 family protein [candidate division KSB1 bacterium]
MPEFRYRSRIEASAEKVFDWHSRPGAFERLKPPWEKVEVVERHGTIKDGDRIVIKTKIGPFAKQWEAVHCDYIEGRQFCDILVKGPFAKWEHTHRFEPDGASACYLEDEIRYDLPFGFLGNLLGKSFTINKLNRMFAYRHQVTQQDLKMHNSREGVQSMKILTTGGNGLIGSALAPFLRTGGHEVNNLTRNKDSKDCCDFHWNPHTEELDTESLEGVEAVVHLAGENIAQRWTEERKSRIKESRAKGTQFLSESLAKLENPPRVLVCASAIGYYGDRGDEVLKEDSPPGDSFLAEVCKEWEAATKPAVQKGIRVVNLRIGVVLSPEGGALAKMLLPFKMGVGGVVGSGEQYWSWIALDDLVGVI